MKFTPDYLLKFTAFKDGIFYTDCRYSVHHCYHGDDVNWIDSGKKKITEKVFSFYLYHKNRALNGEYCLNFLESELGENCVNVLVKFKELVATHRNERKYKILTERAERKLYPVKTHIVFKNVVLTAVEEFERIGKKKITIYANGKPYRYGNFEMDKDFKVTDEFILKCALTKYIMTTNYGAALTNMPKKDKTKINFVPFHFYIGYVIELKGMQLQVTDFYSGSISNTMQFKTQLGDINLEIEDYKNIKVLGEITGINQLSCLMNKLKFMD